MAAPVTTAPAAGLRDRPAPLVRGDGRTVTVVGAGFGGLATAARLAHAGYRVTVLERHGIPGGRAGRWLSEGFTFDTGPSLVMMPEYWHRLFNDCGRRLEDYVTLVQCEPGYKVFFPDGTVFTKSSVLSRFLEECERLSPGSTPGVMGYLAHTAKLYDEGLRFIGRNMHDVSSMLSLRALGGLVGTSALGDLQKLVRKYIGHEQLQQILSFQTLYLGLSPYESMAIYALLPYTELAHGIHYPMGGMHQLPLALERLGRELGVEYVYDASARSFEKDGDRISAVVTADGRRWTSDIVLCNADLPYAYESLLGEPYPGIEKKRFSCSVVLLYIGTSREYPELTHHSFVVGDNMKEGCRQIFEDHVMPDDAPAFYVVATSRTDRSQVPASGGENLFVLLLAPSQPADPARRIDWSVKGPEVEARTIAALEQWRLPGLRDSIVTKRLVTPDHFTMAFGNLRGEAFGLGHDFRQIGWFRPHNRHDRYANLFFAGQSTHPGCGVPIQLISAECAAERIAAELPVR
ncbi:MAG: phytoene desaturase family protein [Gemmatimonadales bacterium]|nr:phytoene desaturase family protein [Gemmatimonadales bacterium]